MVPEGQKDDLTGFYLRKTLFAYLDQLIADSLKGAKGFCLLIFDVDHFKKFNDKFGHPFGDEILKYMASTLTLSLSEKECYFFRYGGDEFIIVAPESTPREALKLAAQFRHNMAHRSFISKGKIVGITNSIGIANYPSDGTSVQELVDKADAALYFSKRHGRNTITLAGKIRQLKIRNALLAISTYCAVITALWVAYNTFRRPIHEVIDTAKTIKVSHAPLNTDRVTLKDGTILLGKISKETNLRLLLTIYSEDGMRTSVNVKKTDIANIEYGLKTESKEKFEEYIEAYPNPHLDDVD